MRILLGVVVFFTLNRNITIDLVKKNQAQFEFDFLDFSN
jgi:hypothetical protein